MNLLLLESASLDAGQVTLEGPRAAHVRDVLRATPGQALRAAVRDGAYGHAVVEALDAGQVRLRFAPEATPPVSVEPIEVVLAMPRPKVLARVLEQLAAFGVEVVHVCNAWRVDKSYLGSSRLRDADVHAALWAGAEQGGHNRLPRVTVYERFMGLMESRFAAPGDETRLVAHAREHGGVMLETVPLHARVVVAIGPEGGWIARELATFAERGFTQVHLLDAILRVEAASAALLGQLAMARRLMAAPIAARPAASGPEFAHV